MVIENLLAFILCVSIANGAIYDNSPNLLSFGGGGVGGDEDVTIFPVAFMACEERGFERKMCKTFGMDSRRCINLKINHNVSTIDTMGYCFRVYRERDCQGETVSFQIDEPAVSNSLILRFDGKIKSIGSCAIENSSSKDLVLYRSKRAKDDMWRYLRELAASAFIAIVQQCLNELRFRPYISQLFSSQPSSSNQYVDTTAIEGTPIRHFIRNCENHRVEHVHVVIHPDQFASVS